MNGRIYRFAEFELVTSEAELRSERSSTRLQEKPLLLLSVLLDNPQRLVTREELRQRMWNSDTFVDYEQGINVAVKKVRDALGDSAQQPRFIETVAKRGYRFLVPVSTIAPDGAGAAENAASASGTVCMPEPAAAGPLSPARPTAAEVPRRAVRARWAIAAAAAGAAIGLGLWVHHVRTRPSPGTRIRSLAVLPLENLSPEPGQDYVADGITEELITNLAQSLPLRVISRTSVMRYKQTSEPIARIARELGADAIVEGSVARSGNRVTVTVQLIDAAADRHLWARRYERSFGELPDVEAGLSQEIASQVGGELIARQQVAASQYRPADRQVYDLCLLGRYHWNKRTADDLRESAEYFRQAIQRDPNYAPAWAGLADAYVIWPHYASVDHGSNFARAAEAARHAIELDDTLAEAHATLGFVAFDNWSSASAQAKHELRRALELNPSYATAHHWYSFHLIFSRRLDEALAEIEVARQLDPLSAIINADEGHLLYAMGRYNDAESRLRRAIELAPGLGQPHETLALIDLAAGRTFDAVTEARAGLALDACNPRTMGEAGYVLAATGHTEEAARLLTSLNDLVRRESAYPVYAALVQVGLGQKSQALDMLEAVANSPRGAGLVGLVQWPTAFSQLNAEPRYRRLMQATGR